MTPRLADLICLPDGSWELCRSYACEQNSGDEDERTLLRLPLELCADGTWTLSGLDDRKFREVFGEFERPIPDVIPEYINAQLHRLSGMQILNEHSWPDDAYPARISGRGCRVLDEIRFSITDLIHALSEPDRGLLERIDESSPTSIFGLLHEAGESDLAYRFVEDCPESLLPLAEIPLVSLDPGSDDGDVRFSFLHAIGSIDWTGEFGLDRSAEQLQVHIKKSGVARIAVTEWMFFRHRFRSVESWNQRQHMGEICVLDELRTVQLTADRLVRRLSNAGRDNLIGSGTKRKLRKRIAARVAGVVRKHLDRHLQQLIGLAKERIYPFDEVPRLASYASYFVGHQDRNTRARRIQARNTTPMLAECIATGNFPRAARAIDKAEPVIHALADEMRVPEWVISRLAKLEELAPTSLDAAAPGRSSVDLTKVAEVMAALGPDTPLVKLESHPQGLVVWDLAERIGSTLDHSHSIFGRDFFGHAKVDTGLMIRAIGREPIATAGGDSKQLVERVEGLASRLANESPSISLYYGIARESIRHHIQFDQDDRADVGRTLSAWLLRQAATELLGAASRVTDVMMMYCREFLTPTLLTALSESTCSLLEAHVCDETGVEIIPLSSKAAVEDEGRQMHHCVGGYWGRAANHQIQLFSLKLGDRNAPATLCLARNLVDRWKVEEFKHAHNREVTHERLLHAAHALCRRLEDASREQFASTTQNISFARHDRSQLALQLLPATSRQQVLAYLPGNGWLEARIERAIETAERIRRGNRRGT